MIKRESEFKPCWSARVKHSENRADDSAYIGHVKNGIIVLDSQPPLKEGQAVRIEPLPQEAPPDELARADRARRLQQLFADWTDEDGKLSDEEADRLQVALMQSRGLALRSPKVR
jgi:hypothetical protein